VKPTASPLRPPDAPPDAPPDIRGGAPRSSEEDEEGPSRLDAHLARELLKARTVILAEGINERSARRIVAQLLLLDGESKEKPIRFFIDSPGGSVDDAFAIFDVIRFINAPVRMIASGIAASAGVLVFLAVPKEHRFTLPNARFLVHQPASVMVGVAADIKIHAQEILKTRTRLNQILAEETGQPLEKVTLDTDRDYWMSAAEAVEYGLASRVVSRESELG